MPQKTSTAHNDIAHFFIGLLGVDCRKSFRRGQNVLGVGERANGITRYTDCQVIDRKDFM